MREVLADYRTAPIAEPLRAVLAFLEKLTLAPAEVGAADVAALRAVGVPDAAVEEALCVCAGFQVITRLSDALDFDVPPARPLDLYARALARHGYAGLAWLSGVPGSTRAWWRSARDRPAERSPERSPRGRRL